MLKFALALLLVSGMLATNLPVCRYTVRDIGFVDLRGQEYVLTIRGGVDEETVKRIRAQLAETNIKLSDETQAQEASADSPPITMSLTDAEGRSVKLPMAPASEASTSPEDIALSMVRDNLFSTTLKELEANANDSFAQLLFIEGSNADANANAKAIVDEAQGAIRRIEPLLPRPLALPLRTQRVASAERAKEVALIWSLGLESSLANASSAEPILAVIYGRGRLAGAPLVGDKIELRETLAQLALVGESCECETDRAWLQERVIPFEWNGRARKAAAEALGFDPESPLVKAEVVSIVSRGPTSRPPESSRTGDGRDDIEQLLLGYDETLVAPVGLTNIGSEVVDPTQPLGSPEPDSGVKVALATGSGWDFDEPTTINDNPSTSTSNGNDGATPSPAGQTAVSDASPDAKATQPESATTAADKDADDPAASSPWFPATVTVGLLGGIILIVFLVLLRGPRN